MDKIFDQRMKMSEREMRLRTAVTVLRTLATQMAKGCALIEIKDTAYSLNCLADAIEVSAETGAPISITVARQLPLLEITEEGKAAIKKAAKKQ